MVKKCEHVWKLISFAKDSGGLDGEGYYETCTTFFFCEKCLALRGKHGKVYYAGPPE